MKAVLIRLQYVGTILKQFYCLYDQIVKIQGTYRKEKALWTDEGEGSKVHFKQFDTAYEEADFITDDIGRKTDKEGVQFGDCAVLYRTIYNPSDRSRL